MASATPDLRLPPKPQGITAPWPVPNYTAWWQAHVREELPQCWYLKAEWPGIEPANVDSQVQRSYPYRNPILNPASNSNQRANVRSGTAAAAARWQPRPRDDVIIMAAAASAVNERARLDTRCQASFTSHKPNWTCSANWQNYSEHVTRRRSVYSSGSVRVARTTLACNAHVQNSSSVQFSSCYAEVKSKCLLKAYYKRTCANAQLRRCNTFPLAWTKL